MGGCLGSQYHSNRLTINDLAYRGGIYGHNSGMTAG